MSDVVPASQISDATLEHVLGTGDISKLTTPQRVEFYRAACKSLGLNPLTRPIRFLTFQGQMQAYFTRDGTDQLRKNNKITLHVVDRQADGDVYVVTVRARMPDGREDEDLGAVPFGRLQGDARANALMKCLTKAKRRVTLSICGLGWASEDELETMPGVQTFDHDAEPKPAVPEPAALQRRAEINKAVPLAKSEPRKSYSDWATALEQSERDAGDDTEQLGKVLARADVAEIRNHAEQGQISPAKTRILDAIARMEQKYLADPPAPPAEDDEAPAIKGEEYVGAG